MIPRFGKFGVWVLLALPAAVTLVRYALDAITYGKVLHETGLWSTGWLVLALCVTPARRVFKTTAWVRLLMVHRRALGVASFGYAAIHTVVYLIRKAELARIVGEAQDPALWTGWLALLLFVALAVTSNNQSVRALGANWKRLHRLVHVAAVLTFAHWYLAAFQSTLALLIGGALVGVQIVRLARTRI